MDRSTLTYCEEAPDSLFVHDKLSSLIQYPLKSYKLPTSHTDKVELDTLSSQGVSFCTRYQPHMVNIRGIKSQIVCGYREILLKRQRIRKLCLLAGVNDDDDDDENCSKKMGNNPSNISISNFSIARGGGGGDDDDDDGSKDDKNKTKEKKEEESSSSNNKKNDQDDIKSKRSFKTKSTFSKATTAKLKNWLKIGGGGSKTSSVAGGGSVDGRKKKLLLKPNFIHGNRKLVTGRKQVKGKKKFPKTPSNGPQDGDDDKKKKDTNIGSEGHLVNETDMNKAETTIYIDPNVIEKPEVEQNFLKSVTPQVTDLAVMVDMEDEEEEAGDDEDDKADGDVAITEENHVLVPVNLGGDDERDNEWLQLSSSNEFEAEERAEADKLFKYREAWMLQGISFESQQFINSMTFYLRTSKYTGRSPFYLRPQYRDRIIEFVVDRRKEFIYFITSIVLWIILGLVTQAALDVAFTSDDEYALQENQEFKKFVIPLIFTIGHLAIVALWSTLVLLNYGLRMVHFFNTWSVALTEMEIDASKGVFFNTVYNNLAFFIYTVLILTTFIIGVPRSGRGCMGIFTILLLRNLVPQVASSTGVTLLVFQIIGLILHLYIIYCARLVYNLIHIYTIALRNAAEMWNLKFALRFEQIPTGTSGYLKHLKIRQTLMKVWLHHRVLTGLCNQLGEIFAAPLMVSFLIQLGIVVYVLTQLFRWSHDTREQREMYVRNETRFPHSHETIPTQLGDVCTALFVLAYLIIDFVVNSYCLASAGQAFRDGFEFVRRKGLILCNTSHERRLIQSLQWSFSATNATEVNLLGFFAVNWETMLSFMSIALLLWSLIIQLQQESQGAVVIYTPNCLQEPRGKRPSPDEDGFCRKKIWIPVSQLDSRAKYIIENIKSLHESLETKARRRRRRHALSPSLIFIMDRRHQLYQNRTITRSKRKKLISKKAQRYLSLTHSPSTVTRIKETTRGRKNGRAIILVT